MKDTTSINGLGSAPIKLYFQCHSNIILFFQPFKIIETIYSLQVIQKQAVDLCPDLVYKYIVFPLPLLYFRSSNLLNGTFSIRFFKSCALAAKGRELLADRNTSFSINILFSSSPIHGPSAKYFECYHMKTFHPARLAIRAPRENGISRKKKAGWAASCTLSGGWLGGLLIHRSSCSASAHMASGNVTVVSVAPDLRALRTTVNITLFRKYGC